MQRRVFLRKSLQSLALITAFDPLTPITQHHYNVLRGGGIKTRFAIASDGHFGQPETAYQQYHEEIIGWLNKEHHNHAMDFSFFNGDLIHDVPSFLTAVKENFSRLEMPYYVSRGNHDRCDVEIWRKTWGEDFTYSFEIEDNAFVVLDTSNIMGEYICPDADSTEEILSTYSSKKNVFVFMHITPVKWTGAGIGCKKLVRMFSRQKNLKAIFHGHDHDQDSSKTLLGKPYFFDSHIGGNWGTDYRGYRMVEITETNEILTYQVNPAAATRVNSTELQDKREAARK